jgi:hypothetical protein
MYSPPSAPRSIGGVLDDTVRLYRGSFSSWIVPSVLLAAFGFVVALLSRVLATVYPGTLPAAGTTAVAAYATLARTPGFWLGFIVFLVIYLAVYLTVYAVVVANILTVATTGQAKVRSNFKAGLALAPGVLLGFVLSGLAMGVGVLLLLIPGIYVWGRLQYWIVALVDERQGALASLNTSWRIVAGHWWRSTTILTVWVIIMVVLFFVIGMIAGMAAATAKGDAAGLQLVTQLVSGVLNIFTVPFIPCALVAIYRDLKLRAEGADLAARISKLQPT